MKYEPLKGKERVIQYIGNIRRMDGGIHRIPFIKRGFLTDDVKSAVQGLLEDLERAKRVTCDENKKAHLDYCIYLVKKWFPDVVEERVK